MHPFSQPTETGRRDIQSRYILMPVSMLVKCEKCGYENFPQHRFCGMCAAELRLPGPGGVQSGASPTRLSASPVSARTISANPVSASPISPTPISATPISVTPISVTPISVTPAAAARARKEEVVAQKVSGPSFLGLGNEPADSRSVSYLLEED